MSGGSPRSRTSGTEGTDLPQKKYGERKGDKDGLDGEGKHYEKGHLLIQHLKNSPGQRALPLIIKGNS